MRIANVTVMLAAKMRRSQQRAKIYRAYILFANFIENVLATKNIEK